MSLNETQPENEPTGPRVNATDRAVAAVERLVDTGNMVGNAYADAYQQAVINMAGFRGKLGDASPADGLELVSPPATVGPGPLSKPLRDATTTATRASESLFTVSRQLSLAYVDAYEKTVRSLVDVRKEPASSTDGE